MHSFRKSQRTSRFWTGMASLLLLAILPASAATNDPLDGPYIATAYDQTGITASGIYTHMHVVAADPTLLPIGTRIKIRHAGRYSGEYVVADTGEKVEGRRLDIYVPNEAACRKFGKRQVKVQVIQLGNGTHEAAKQSDQAVKHDVATDVSKGVVGNAATEADWAKKTSADKKATTPGAGSTSTATSTNPK